MNARRFRNELVNVSLLLAGICQIALGVIAETQGEVGRSWLRICFGAAFLIVRQIYKWMNESNP